MTLNGAIMQLVEMRENSMMPVMFKPYFDKVIETISECVEPSEIPQWIPVTERLPEEDHWLGGSGKQFSDNVLISIVNRDDEDAWVQVSQTIDGTWALELPRYCKVVAWMPLPEPYAERRTDEKENI